jgi:hypothetical protein
VPTYGRRGHDIATIATHVDAGSDRSSAAGQVYAFGCSEVGVMAARGRDDHRCPWKGSKAAGELVEAVIAAMTGINVDNGEAGKPTGAIPMPAVGKRHAQPAIASMSVVASLQPCRVKGAFVSVLTGNTAHPRRARASADVGQSGTVGVGVI